MIKMNKSAQDQNWIAYYNKKVERERHQQQQMFEENDYIVWLENFTSLYPQFHDEKWLYHPQDISDRDRENVDALNLFYNGIQCYAVENFIYPEKYRGETYYSIQFNGIGYEIGVINGQGGSVFFCNRSPITNKVKFIKFEDIQMNKKNPNKDFIAIKLQELSNLMSTIAEENIPLEAIAETTKTTMKRLIKKRNKKQ